MASRTWPRLYTMGNAALHWGRRRERPSGIRRLLIVHHLLLGDTIMLTPLLKKARASFPQAEIVMTCRRPYVPLYEGKPYGVVPIAFDDRSLHDHVAVSRGRGFDLAIVPGDNRWSWLARAAGAEWIVAFASDRPGYKDWPIDEVRHMPIEPTAWGDMAATLLDGPEPEPYQTTEWPAPQCAAFDRPKGRYCVLHLGAGNPNRLWPSDRWRTLMTWAERAGYEVAFTVGPGEEPLAHAVDETRTRSRLAGQLDLAQLWHLFHGASFLVCPDTGIAHLARLVGVPTVAIYGQGSPVSTGPGRFWRHSPFKALWDANVSCRNQDDFFGRRLVWLRQCARTVRECSDPFCIRRVTVEQVSAAIDSLLTRN